MRLEKIMKRVTLVGVVMVGLVFGTLAIIMMLSLLRIVDLVNKPFVTTLFSFGGGFQTVMGILIMVSMSVFGIGFLTLTYLDEKKEKLG